MADYASNTPISKPVIHAVDQDADFGGLAWNNKTGLFFPVEDEMPPFRRPIDHTVLDSRIQP